MIKLSCVKTVNSENGNYFTKGATYKGYENELGELYATDDNGKNFNVGLSVNDNWFQEHFVIVNK